MAHLTKGRFGYYINRDYVLPTSTAKFIMAAAAQDAAKKTCACHGSCGHCGGRQYRRMSLRGLGDDTIDFSSFGPPVDSPIVGPYDYSATFPTSPDLLSPTYQDVLNNPDLYFTPTNANSGVVYGPPAPGQPGGVAAAAPSLFAAAGNVLASIFRPSSGVQTLTPAQQQALALQQQQSLTSGLTMPIAGIGLSPLTIGAIVLGGVLVISLVKSGKRR
jgi:hypothetical protein